MARWQVVDGLYMGGLPQEQDTLDCDLVVNLAGGQCWPRNYMQYILWTIDDGALPDLSNLWAIAHLVETQVANKKTVLVHCGAGLNRSGLVTACAYKLLEHCTGAVAMNYVRERRQDPNCLSNQNFAAFLRGLG